MLEFRTGGAQIVMPGVRVVQAGGGAVANWWEVTGETCIAAYQPIGAASLAASYVNLATPGTFDAAPGVAPAWGAATGWTFNGTTQYLTTGIAPANDQSWSAIARFGDVTNFNGYLIGMYISGSQRFGLLPRISGDMVAYQNGSSLTAAGALVGGILAVAGSQGYRNGVADGGAIGGWGGVSAAFYIGARRRVDLGSLDGLLGATIQALAIYSTTLGSSDVAALTTRMQAL